MFLYIISDFLKTVSENSGFGKQAFRILLLKKSSNFTLKIYKDYVSIPLLSNIFFVKEFTKRKDGSATLI